MNMKLDVAFVRYSATNFYRVLELEFIGLSVLCKWSLSSIIKFTGGKDIQMLTVAQVFG